MEYNDSLSFIWVQDNMWKHLVLISFTDLNSVYLLQKQVSSSSNLRGRVSFKRWGLSGIREIRGNSGINIMI
jgi:hypothetical protein